MNATLRKQILANPDGWARKAKITELVSVLNEAKDHYYNSTSGKIMFPDEAYDAMEDVLAERSPTQFKKLNTGAPIKHVLSKVKLPRLMPSLNKIKTEPVLTRWMAKRKGEVIAMDKLDGISFLLTKTDGALKLYTRGDGVEGKDITPFIPHLKGIPKVSKIPEGFMGRGELIMSNAKFAKWEGEAKAGKFVNARNMIAGITNRQDIHAGFADTDAIFYERMDKKLRPSKQLDSLKKLGFHVVSWTDFDGEPDFNTLVEVLNDQKKKTKYAIDGIVVVEDLPHAAPTDNPSWAIAFKQNAEADTHEVKVTALHWQESRQGRMTPVIEIEPTKMAGVTVKRATGHNGDNIIAKGIGPGAIIKVVRSGDVIPYIADVIKPVKVKLPPNTEWRGAYLYLKEKTDLGYIQSIAYFFTTLGVDGLKIGSTTKMFEEGYDSILLLLKATEAEYVDVLGVNGKKIYASIKAKLAKPDLATLMAATGYFENWSVSRLGTLIDELGDVTKMKPLVLAAHMREIHGIGAELIRTFTAGIDNFKDFLKVTKLKYDIPEEIDGPLNGEVVVFTGFRNKEWVEQIGDLGGTYKDGVTKATTILVAKSKSSKTDKAEALGVKVMTPDQFQKKYL